jgi:preprotein translocase subunit SecD
MKKNIQTRVILLALTVLVSILFFLPSTPWYSDFPDWWKKYLPSKGITLGLDLQGGIYLILEVEEDKAVENLTERTANYMKTSLDEKKLSVQSVKRISPTEISIQYPESGPKEDILKAIEADFPTFSLKEEKPGELLFTLGEGEVKRIKDNATSQALETIRNRIDQFGVAEPLIQRQGTDQIVIQLPGVKDPQRAKRLIGETAQLEFKLLDDDTPVAAQLPFNVPPGQEESIVKEFQPKVPEGDEILFERVVNKETGQVTKRPYIVKKRAVLTGDLLTDARVSISQFNEPYVSITFDPTGARVFAKVTAENVKKRLAIILDNVIYSAPVIQESIPSGRAQINGNFTTQEANDLAIVLRAGALPAPVRTLQDLTVGPSLGQDSIEKGIRATAIAGILVVIFMVFYYRLSGLIADFALILNLVVLVGALAALNATLTLPGIAGVILTIGMGVDSNVLIFERIREELRQKKPVRLAVDGGYEKAFLTIIDSHVTTLITAFILFLFGTGPIKGFAVSLSLGITINLFTALVGTKVVFDWINSRKKLEWLSI